MRLRTVVAGASLCIIAASLLAALLAATSLLSTAARKDLDASVERSRRVFDDMRAYRSALLRSTNQVASDEPRLKAVTSAVDVSAETVRGVAEEMHAALDSDLFIITDEQGTIIADASDPEARGHSLAHHPSVIKALADGESAALWTSGDAAFQVYLSQLRFGATPVGLLVTGHALTSDVAATVERQTGTSVAILIGDKIVAASPLAAPLLAEDDLGGQLAAIPSVPTEVVLAGGRFVALGTALPGHHGPRPVRAVLFQSLDAALAPARRLNFILSAVLGASLLAGVVLSGAVARRVVRPVQALVDHTHRVGRGQLEERIVPSGPTEIRTLATSMNSMADELVELRRVTVQQERLQHELKIAANIQVSILPREIQVPHLEVAATMVPATEVGGDYYDVMPTGDAAWIGIGDVAGHGVAAGIVMLMIQSATNALVRADPSAAPSSLVCRLNEVLFENIRQRLRADEHVTLTLLRVAQDGKIVFAGAHEEILVHRAATGAVEAIQPPGTWLGARRDISRGTQDTALQLAPGDTVLLHTDGVTEARDAAREEFGADRLRAAFGAAAPEGPARCITAVEAALRAHAVGFDDDFTVVAFRFTPPAASLKKDTL